MMTPEQSFQFHTQGFFVMKKVLNDSVVSGALEVIRKVNAPRDPRTGKFSFMGRSRLSFEIMTTPAILDVVERLCGTAARFDVAFGLHHDLNAPIQGDLHGGPRAEQGAYQYSSQCHTQWSAPLKFGIALTPVTSGDGGFICVPGSHHHYPPHYADLHHQPHYSSFPWLTPDHPLVYNPSLEPGDAVVFTDAMIHGTRKWGGHGGFSHPFSHPYRIALIYSYAPPWFAERNPETLQRLREAAVTDTERDLLRPPGIRYCDEDVALATGKWENEIRTPIRRPLPTAPPSDSPAPLSSPSKEVP